MVNKQTNFTKGENFLKSARCKNNHSSDKSNLSWCDLNKKVNLLKVNDMCPNPKVNVRNRLLLHQIIFSLKALV